METLTDIGLTDYKSIKIAIRETKNSLKATIWNRLHKGIFISLGLTFLQNMSDPRIDCYENRNENVT